ncbi:Fe-S cluster assembly sulfur transfer protein SufU [Agrococcus sp. ARC_14]|uniref:Fe-S cluster assembly sulfur transfer protein SufU n=1 Tax=Agrococcus sp. ARC_14 TaxID=2919927 RepID=UPI001F0517FF|nr:SUF system NifU family Fe-S cluster assembly protein [Agrococcus sp. ARC_14]MCH1884251.1 SUF system NifU family Fe-S cluster assembly protein [Agrococcus sp. ARC_14]
MADPLAGLYQELILEHSKRRSGEGEIEPFDAERFLRNPTCGDEIRLRVRLDVTGDEARVDALGWVGQGCSISQASASVLAEEAPGLTVAEVRERIEALRELLRSRGTVEPDEQLLGDAVAFAGVAKFPMRVKCAMLAWVALEDALAQLDR